MKQEDLIINRPDWVTRGQQVTAVQQDAGDVFDEAAFEASVKYSQERQQFKRPISSFQTG